MEERGILIVEVTRPGSVDEVLQFLINLQDAYENLYALKVKIESAIEAVEEPNERRPSAKKTRSPVLAPSRRARDVVLPDERMIILRIEISSPGGWEFLASLNPLQQLREWAKDRHERRKDKEWREAEQRREMVLENEKREREVHKADLQNIQLRDSILSGQINTLLSLGYTQEQVRRLLNAHYFGPLSYLDQHFDSGLIESIDVQESNPE